MPVAYFLGQSDRKFTHPDNPNTGRFTDYCIRLDELSDFPIGVKLTNSKFKWVWEFPGTDRYWDLVVRPLAANSVALHFPCPNEALKYFGRFKDDDYAPFHVELRFLDGSSVVDVTDGRPVLEPQDEFAHLQSLLEAWPTAAAADSICNEDSHDEKINRANVIVEQFIGSPEVVSKLRFLDFGCGDGAYIAKQVAEFKAVSSIGYDPVLQDHYVFGNLMVTNSLVDVAESPDVILLFDVLDHVENMEDVMRQVHSLCKLNTKVICRCHPFSGRHGGHLYRSFNKAFAHVVFSDDELISFGLEPFKGQKVRTPTLEYKVAFAEAGFKVVNEDIEYDLVEDIFAIDTAIKRRFQKRGIDLKNASISHIDYILETSA